MYWRVAMSPSRKNLSRGKLRRKRQLRDLWERSESKDGEGPDVPPELIPETWVERFKVELIFLVVLIAGIVTVISFGPNLIAEQALRKTVSDLLIMDSWMWEEAYPAGYKIIALKDEKIVLTNYDSLPKGLKINWKKIAISRIQADQLRSTFEKIDIKISNVNYASKGISGRSAHVTLTRRVGSTATLMRLGDVDFIVKIVEDDGSHIFCLFGLRSV